MSSAVTSTSGGLVVVTQVYPSDQPQPQPQGIQQVGPRSQRFIQAYPLAVGTVQIMIGVFVFLLGIVKLFHLPSFGVVSGIFVWGPAFYITSGALTVAAGKSPSPCLINTALGFNVVSSVAAFIGIVLYSLDADGGIMPCWSYDCVVMDAGFAGILLVFHILELFVSITVSIFACRAPCECCDSQQHPYVYFTPAQAPPQTVPATMAVPPQQIPSFPKSTEDQLYPELTEPPAYTG